MVQIPQYQAQQGLEVPGAPRVALDNSVAEGVTRLGSAGMVAGNALGDTASYLRGKQEEMAAYLRTRDQNKARFDAQVNLDKLNEELNQDLVEAERAAPADGSGLYDGFVGKSLDPKTQAFLSTIPDPEVRAEYEKRMEAFREQWDNNGVNKQYELGNRYSLARIGEMGDSRARGIAANPVAADSFVKEMDGIIDTAPNLTTPQREEMKRKFRLAVPGIVADSLKQTDIETLRFAAGNGTNDERIKFLATRLRPAITQAESAGDPNAVSPAGAVGLMQVMPDTGEEIARKLGDKAYLTMSRAEREAFLKNPENNVRYGTTYLEMMLERYKGDAEAALIAYNSGPGNADKWVKAGRDYSVLPKRSETEPYVQRVMANLGVAKLASGPPTAVYVVGAPDGLLEKGNIDIANRPHVKNADGSTSTVRSMSFEEDGREILIPTVSEDGKILSDNAAIALYHKTGRHLGIFRSASDATRYAEALHEQQAANSEPGSSGPDGAHSGFVSPVFADMPAPALLEMQISADTATEAERMRLKTEQDALKVETARTADDDIASISASGQGVVSPADRDVFEARILDTQGVSGLVKYREDRIVAETVFNATKDAGRMSDQDLAAIVASLSKPVSGENAALRQRIADGTRKGIEAVIAERKDDPASAAVKHFPEVAAAWENANDPASTQAALDATVLAQQKMGIPGDKINPLPADRAKTIADRVRDETLPAETRIAALMQAVASTPDANQQEQIVRQFVRAGLSPKVANVVEAWKRGDIGATRRLFQAAMLTPETAPKLGASDNTLSASVEEAMLGTGTIGADFYGLDLGDPRMAEVASSDVELAKSAARLAMAAGMDDDAAIEQAVTDIFGPVETISGSLDNGGSVKGVIDQGVDQGVLLRGFDAANGKMVDVLQGYLARAYGQIPKDATPEMQAVFKAAHANEVNRVLRDGVWRNNGAGWSLYDPQNRGFIGDDTGKPVVFTTEQLIQLGGGDPSVRVPKKGEPDMFNLAPDSQPAGSGGFGMPPEPAPGRQGNLKVPPAPDTSLVGGLKAQGKALAAKGPLKDGSLQRILPPSMQLNGIG